VLDVNSIKAELITWLLQAKDFLDVVSKTNKAIILLLLHIGFFFFFRRIDIIVSVGMCSLTPL